MAGSMARRIKNYLHEGENVVMADKLGKILFGSRVEISMPSVVRVVVHKGEKMKAGETIIARY